MTGLLIRSAEVAGRGPFDVRIRDGFVRAIAGSLDPGSDETIVDARGGALLPGLKDHHTHLLALAASLDSVPCGPPQTHGAAALARALASAPAATDGWIRGVGYHESVAGPLDRWRLDGWRRDVPVRVQHRSGALWILNSAALRALDLDDRGALPEGVGRDTSGRLDGRFFRLDAWLRGQRAPVATPGLAAVGRLYSSLGVTGLCDASVSNGDAEVAMFAAARAADDLPQRLRVMGGASLAASPASDFVVGQLKVMLDEDRLADVDALVRAVEAAHAAGRGAAFHCVTRAELVVAAHALQRAGPHADDRIEHASVTPPDLMALLREQGVAVVTQPNFVGERGDTYLDDVTAADQPWLYRGRAFLAAGIALAGGTDAPFGAPDPWAAMRAAVHRTAPSGRCLGVDEALTPEEALALFTSRLDAPGRAYDAVAVGERADLCLLDRPWALQRTQLDAGAVRATVIAGRIGWRRDAAGRHGE